MRYFFSSLILHILLIFILLIKDLNKINYLTEQIKKESIKKIEKIKITESIHKGDLSLIKKINNIHNQNKRIVDYKIKIIYKKNKSNIKNKNLYNIIKTFVYVDQKLKKTNHKITILFIFDKNGYIKSYRFINYNNEFPRVYENIRVILNSDFIQSFHDDLSKNCQALYIFNF